MHNAKCTMHNLGQPKLLKIYYRLGKIYALLSTYCLWQGDLIILF